MICKNCGADVDDALLLCPHCGQEMAVVSKPKVVEETPVVDATTAQPVAPTPARGKTRAKGSPGRTHGLSGWVWLISLIILISCVMVAFAAAGFSGLYQGLKDRDRLNQETSRQHYNRGLEHLQAQETELAMAEFEEAIRLDPRFVDAYERLKELKVKATVEPTATSVIAEPVISVTFSDAQTEFDAGKWTDSIATLQQLKSSGPTADATQIDELLYSAYVKNGEALLAQSSMEEALRSFDSALTLKPDDPVAAEQKRLISAYVVASGLAGANWDEALRQLTELYSLKPDFADVKDRLYEDHVDYGDFLAQKESWCDAADQYASALELSADAKLKTKQADMAQKCQTNPPTPTPVGQSPSMTDTVNSAQPKPAKPTIAPKPTKAAALVASQGSVSTQPVTTTEPAPASAAPAAAPAGSAPVLSGALAYSVRDPDGITRIYQLKLDGSSSPEIIVQQGSQPAFSQDGTKLAFHSLQSDLGGLRVANAGGRDGVNITKFSEDGYPSWGPDGTQVALASTREGDRRWRIFTTWAGGIADSVQVGLGESPAWSSKGMIAYHGCDARGGNCGIWAIAPNGGNLLGLTTSESDTAPAWSPDGARLAFMSARDGNWEIYRINGDGGDPLRLTSEGANDGLPAWSPDGSTVAFVSDRGGAWALYAVSANGGEAAKIWDVPSMGQNWMEQRLAWRK